MQSQGYQIEGTQAVPTKIRHVANIDDHINFSVVFYTVCIVFIGFISIYSIVLLCFGILPGVVAKIVDNTVHRSLTKIVTMFNALGLSNYFLNILRNLYNADVVALQMITTPHTWLAVYVSCAIGWIIYLVVPKIFVLVENLKIEMRLRELHANLKDITDEWGEDIVKGEEA